MEKDDFELYLDHLREIDEELRKFMEFLGISEENIRELQRSI